MNSRAAGPTSLRSRPGYTYLAASNAARSLAVSTRSTQSARRGRRKTRSVARGSASPPALVGWAERSEAHAIFLRDEAVGTPLARLCPPHACYDHLSQDTVMNHVRYLYVLVTDQAKQSGE